MAFATGGDVRPTAPEVSRYRFRRRPGQRPRIERRRRTHYRLGAGLAWAELDGAFALLAPRMRDLRIDGEVGWGSPIGIYDIKSLPLAFTPGP